MTLHFLSNSELLRLAENSDNPLIIELAKRLDDLYDKGYNIDKIEENDSKKYKNLCISYLAEVSGEDYHSDIISRILKINSYTKKQDREEECNAIANSLSDMDYNALNVIENVKILGLEQ